MSVGTIPSTEKEPSHRWSTAAEMMGALEAAGAGRIDERRPAPAVAETVAGPEEATLAAAPAAPAAAAEQVALAQKAVAVPPGSRFRLWPLVGALVAFLLIGAVAAYELLPSGARPNGGILPTPVATASSGETPTPGVVRRVSVSPPSPLHMGTTITVTGTGLDPKRDAGAGILQGGAVHPISSGMSLQADGSFSVDGIVPTDITPGPAALVACNLDSQHKTDLAQCIQLNVTIVR